MYLIYEKRKWECDVFSLRILRQYLKEDGNTKKRKEKEKEKEKKRKEKNNGNILN